MIISPPILKPQPIHQTDDEWIDSILPHQSVADGEFPISAKLAWHGGYHVKHTDNSAVGNPVRAIADGVVVYSRASSGTPANGVEPLGYNGVTDDGCVVIQHTTEIGDQVSVTYYSVYMHMRKEASYEGVIRKGMKVYRKQEIGLIGRASDQNMIHMEVVCDQENLEKLVGRNTPELDLSKDGRTTVVYGDIHFYLPIGTKFYVNKNVNSAISYTSTTQLFVTLHFEKGEAYLSTRKEIVVGSGVYQAIGEASLVQVTKPHQGTGAIEYYQYEYDLYTIATKLATAPVSASAVYELLRFGRILDTEVEPSDIGDVKHWHKVNYGNGSGYVNLNVPEIIKFSDGDFPHWMGWRLIDDDPTPDSQCNSPILQKWLDTNADSKNTHDELVTALDSPIIQASVSKTICNFPTEWAKSLVDTQYSWLTSPSDTLPEPLTPDDYTKFKAHVTALSFWEDMQAPATGALPPTKHWHFHPREFIKHFRKCGWLSVTELAQCFPRKHLTLRNTNFVSSTVTWQTAFTQSSLWTLPFNTATRKYGISHTRQRLVHFFAHVIPETGFLKLMKEGDNASGTYLISKDYYPYYGRGLIQLTWKDTYIAYGDFRGFPHTLSTGLYHELHWNPDELIARTNSDYNATNCADSACYYVTSKSGMVAKMDNGIAQADAIAVSKCVNGNVVIEKLNGLDVRLQSILFLRDVLLDGNSDALTETMVFSWRRNSEKEPTGQLNAQGLPIKKFFLKNPPWEIQVPLDKQRP